ncbi:MAG TPA: glycosyltransferase family 2 protein [Microlunatus sp.]|nr:glycosyltransferase family 2 protein [Microlunatus sp.]
MTVESYRTSTGTPCLSLTQYRVRRVLESLPGVMVWATLAAPFVLTAQLPHIAHWLLPLYVLYWMLQYVNLAVRQVWEFVRLRLRGREDWLARARATHGEDLDQLHHLVVFPTYNESPEILRQSIGAIEDANYDPRNITVCVTFEERSPVWTPDVIAELEDRFRGSFARFLTTRHPDGLPGEERVKGANLTWGAQYARKVLHAAGLTDDQIVVSAFDADTRASRDYFAALADAHLSNPNRDYDAYQPILLFHNNVWDVPIASRIVGSIATFWTMVDSTQPHRMKIFSSHAMGMKALVKVNYWCKTVIPDDSRQYWRMFFAFDGRTVVRPLHAPVYLDAVQAESYGKSLREQYLQLRRWSYGVIDFTYIAEQSLTSPKISFWFKALQLSRQYLQFQFWATTPLMLLIIPRLVGELHMIAPYDIIGGWIAPLLFGVSNVVSTAVLPVGLAVSVAVATALLPKRPAHRPWWWSVKVVAEWALMPIIVPLFICFPAIDAQTRLIFRRYLGFRVTVKQRTTIPAGSELA